MEDNYCEIDPNTVDKYGIPVLRFHYKWSDYEVKQAKHMKETFAEIIDKMGGVITWGNKMVRKMIMDLPPREASFMKWHHPHGR